MCRCDLAYAPSRDYDDLTSQSTFFVGHPREIAFATPIFGNVLAKAKVGIQSRRQHPNPFPFPSTELPKRALKHLLNLVRCIKEFVIRVLGVLRPLQLALLLIIIIIIIHHLHHILIFPPGPNTSHQLLKAPP
jgi:hypothetical protein